ncbi:MAG: formate dehydrogenase subunit gamma [Paracoccus hibiscisoli]|uniref:formate dehydrogenase subunit gamma n=1 Tax=Paracoccus hibiscisoli TaxID=2023261 RepID=UPI003919E21A
MTHHLNRLFGVIALSLGLMLSAPMAQAQVDPTSSAVSEDSMFEALGTAGTSDAISGRVSIPNKNAGTLIKPDNKNWAGFQRGALPWIFVVALGGMIALLAAFYLIKGRIRVEHGFSGRTILRFSAIERFAHWTLSSTFIILALTGVNVVIGRSVILPLVGEAAFGTMTQWGKLAHNFLAWPFMVALVLIIIFWVAHNIPSKLDLVWIKQGGGLFKKGVHPPAKKFNAGQKVIFWSVVIGGVALSFTGYMMLFPLQAGTPSDWQLYQTIHGLVAAGLSAVIIAHIYIGSVGMEGAFDAMASGQVDENWAKEHHSLWVEEVKAREGQTVAGRTHPAE